MCVGGDLIKKEQRIGIITHHYVHYYGAFLQAYALQETLISLYPSDEIEIINYVNLKHYLASLRPLLIAKKPSSKNVVKSINAFLERKKQLSQFYKAKRYLNLSPHMHNYKDINQRKYDTIVIGSDEVWNINQLGLDKIKFAVGLDCPNIISYAASCGYFLPGQEIPSFVSQGIKNFNKISVRDIQTKSMIGDFYNGKIELVLDPTFLYDFKSEVKEIGNLVDIPYILVYQCELDPDQIHILREFAKKEGMIIVGSSEHRDWFDKSFINISPFEWIELFNKSKYVITGAFHGTIFAIKANKKFISFPTKINREQKIRSLLTTLGLEKQFVSKMDKYRICDYLVQDINYSVVDKTIEELKEKSIMFLKEAICSKREVSN